MVATKPALNGNKEDGKACCLTVLGGIQLVELEDHLDW